MTEKQRDELLIRTASLLLDLFDDVAYLQEADAINMNNHDKDQLKKLLDPIVAEMEQEQKQYQEFRRLKGIYEGQEAAAALPENSPKL